MACSSCGGGAGRKINAKQSANVVQKVTSFKDEDFSILFYVGQTDVYVGGSTGINYGKRTTGSRLLIHKLDVLANPELFSETLPVPTPEVVEPLVIPVAKRSKKQVDQNSTLVDEPLVDVSDENN